MSSEKTVKFVLPDYVFCIMKRGKIDVNHVANRPPPLSQGSVQ